MKRILLPLLAVSALAFAGCETATPYQPISARNSSASGGYSEHQIEANRWSVTFAGNSLTARQTVEKYLLYRSAELTLAQGFDWFATTDRQTDKQTSSYVDPDPYFAGGGYWGPRWGFYRRGYGWGYGRWGDPFWGEPLDVNTVSQYEATAEIVMGHGAKPADRNAFDARSVISHLGPAVAHPQG